MLEPKVISVGHEEAFDTAGELQNSRRFDVENMTIFMGHHLEHGALVITIPALGNAAIIFPSDALNLPTELRR